MSFTNEFSTQMHNFVSDSEPLLYRELQEFQLRLGNLTNDANDAIVKSPRIEKLSYRLPLDVADRSVGDGNPPSDTILKSGPIFTTIPTTIPRESGSSGFSADRATREEIPFERFSFDYPRSYKSQRFSWLRSRVISFLHTLEGTARLIAHLATFTFKKIVEKVTSCKFKVSSNIHLKVFKTQARGLFYSMYAVVSPALSLKKYERSGNTGCTKDKWDWGTPYSGKRTFYIAGTYDSRKANLV